MMALTNWSIMKKNWARQKQRSISFKRQREDILVINCNLLLMHYFLPEFLGNSATLWLKRVLRCMGPLFTECKPPTTGKPRYPM
mmetsp:Transcript_15452/g.34692  ORF Transcript_15452/g.34692 Transcript_15452/m.34692 type:complete len:84 (-) Transcript_15452:738-989(-)